MSRENQPLRATKRIERIGIRCPDCQGKTRVWSTRHGPGEKTRRVRYCPDCGTRLRTYELIIESQTE